MHIYNSLSKTVETFTPVEAGKVKMYSCGPTVYNNLHIGNLSAFIYADLLRRTLRASGFEVHAVMNITDVDDKTIRDSKRDYPELEPMEALTKLTRKYEQVFKDDIERIGNDTTAITFIRATETIEEMIQITSNLLKKGIAYPADDGIYFSIKKYEAAGFTYGILQKINHSNASARIANDEYDKDSASDFALWKKGEDGEPSWEATFTHEDKTIKMPGRPGWHIECSAMSQKLLDVPFDIHTGGIDLKFPHHENEIAQSCGATNSAAFAHYFIHNNHLLIDGKKMSKSLGNFFTLRDIEEKGFEPLAFRLLVLSSHYQSESNFTWEILEAAQNRLANWRSTASLVWQTESRGGSAIDFGIKKQLQNNLDTPAALAAVDHWFSTFADEGKSTNLESLESLVLQIHELLGIDLKQPDISAAQKQLIQDREQARAANDWTRSDEIRNQLEEQGLEIRDTPHGSIWSRI
jgi:cysteinyl-tRNA synthetase